jgi:hypothetical protein
LNVRIRQKRPRRRRSEQHHYNEMQQAIRLVGSRRHKSGASFWEKEQRFAFAKQKHTFAIRRQRAQKM